MCALLQGERSRYDVMAPSFDSLPLIALDFIESFRGNEANKRKCSLLVTTRLPLGTLLRRRVVAALL